MKTFSNCKRLRDSKRKRHLKKQKRNQKNKEKAILRSRWKLRTKIQKMPLDIQKKLCIWTWRLYWREFVPVTAKVPSWMYFHTMQQRYLWESRLNNIHFLHLPMNTLPENKKWIMGCQCNFCLTTETPSRTEKIMRIMEHLEGSNHFNKSVPQETISFWNSHYYLCGKYPVLQDGQFHMMKIFDPLCGSIYEDVSSSYLRRGIPIHFDLEEIE